MKVLLEWREDRYRDDAFGVLEASEKLKEPFCEQSV
jgi:hypothetical protein